MAKEIKKSIVKARVQDKVGLDVYVDRYEEAMEKILNLTLKFIDDLNQDNLSTQQKLRFLEMVLPYLKSSSKENYSKYALLYKQLSQDKSKEKEALILIKQSLNED